LGVLFDCRENLVEILLEKNKTYRIPFKEKTTLLQIVDILEKSIKIKDIKTNRIYRVKKSVFQKGLQDGTIYVSA